EFPFPWTGGVILVGGKRVNRTPPHHRPSRSLTRPTPVCRRSRIAWRARRGATRHRRVKVSYFETVRYRAPAALPAEWPVAPGVYEPEVGRRAYVEMVERLRLVEDIGFDWVSVSEHHYSPRILSPSPIVVGAYIAAHVKRMTIAVLGPIVPQSNPVRLAEELAMLDTLAQGRLVVGLLRGTTNEYLTYDLNPPEAREQTDEGLELILRAWTEPQPFGWQGRHFQYRTVSIWPRPLQQPHPPTDALRTSRESWVVAP